MMGNKGELIRVPNLCLYGLLLKVKKIEFIISCNTIKNSSLEILHSKEMYVHLLEILSRARLIGMFVKSNTASKKTMKLLLSVLIHSFHKLETIIDMAT